MVVGPSVKICSAGPANTASKVEFRMLELIAACWLGAALAFRGEFRMRVVASTRNYSSRCEMRFDSGATGLKVQAIEPSSSGLSGGAVTAESANCLICGVLVNAGLVDET